MSKKRINVALIGQKFMGRAHSNAYQGAKHFFDLPVDVGMKKIVARDLPSLQKFAEQWGWDEATTDWKGAITSPDIDLVDVTTPNNKHGEFVFAALEAGKIVACEKPLAATLSEARAMRDAAVKAKARTFVWYNYRRVPAVGTAYRLFKEGRIGRVYHINAFYRQGWASSPDIPLIWRFDKEQSGSGALGDIGAHVIDMARFITGDEVAEITGAIAETFVKERTIPSGAAGAGIAAGISGGAGVKGKVTVDDATIAIGRMNSGATLLLDSTRFATGRENKNGVEISGDKGALFFDFEDLNNLYFYDATLPAAVRGWTKIQASMPNVHPYQAHFWPTAHPLGYEHAFVNQAADMFRVLGGEQPELPLPDFEDAYQTQRVLEAIELSAKNRGPVKLAEVK